MVLSGFKPDAEVFQRPPTIIPSDPTLNNFERLSETRFPRQVANSIIVAVYTTIFTTIFATLGGYGLTRSDFRNKKTLARVVLFAYMFPPVLLGIPLYLLFFKLGLLNTHIVLAIAHTAIALPFCLWLMWQFFQTLPRSYEESAWIYGAGRIRALWSVVLPQAVPGVIAVAIFAFAVSWNDFTLAVILLTENSMRTFPLGLNDLLAQQSVRWGMVNAASILIMLPPLLIVYFLQKYIMVGFRIGR
jgi:multiple sugar transport system permease protein